MLFKAGALADVIARPTTALWPSSDLRHGPRPLGRDAEARKEYIELRTLYEAFHCRQHSKTTHGLSQDSVPC
jgi:hypothetical protein